MLAGKAVLFERFGKQTARRFVQRLGGCRKFAIFIDDECSDVCVRLFSKSDFHE